MFLSVGSTPYDQQMSRIRPVLLEAASSARQNVSLGLVNQWIGDLRGIPYGYSPEWKTPDEVYHGPAADCKGKAVALYERMRSRGAENIRLVIGKRTATSRRTHAWLEWKTANGTYILDPTINCSAFTSGQTGNKSYLPLYAYSGNRKYRAADISLYAQN
jgi:predicted transglutaminase-like cysteine proteinase